MACRVGEEARCAQSNCGRYVKFLQAGSAPRGAEGRRIKRIAFGLLGVARMPPIGVPAFSASPPAPRTYLTHGLLDQLDEHGMRAGLRTGGGVTPSATLGAHGIFSITESLLLLGPSLPRTPVPLTHPNTGPDASEAFLRARRARLSATAALVARFRKHAAALARARSRSGAPGGRRPRR
jgi:hypothetical protein